MTVAVSPAHPGIRTRSRVSPRWALRLAHRSLRMHPPVSGAMSASTAFVTLSPGLVAVVERTDGTAATHQEIGAAGMTVHQAWNAAAGDMRDTACTGGEVEFWVREASLNLGTGSPPGLEVRGSAAGWCAHPLLFRILHEHFTGVFGPSPALTYLTVHERRLFVFPAPAAVVARDLTLPAGALLFRYSLGFPLLALR